MPSSRRWIVATALVVACVLTSVSTTVPAATAQEDPPPTAPQDPPPTAPPTTAPQDPPPTAPPTTAQQDPPPTTAPPAGSDTTADPALETTTTIDPVNPLQGEGPTETVPTRTVTIPPRSGGYANQPDFKPPRVLWGNVRLAVAKVAAAEAAHREAISRVKSTRLRTKEVEIIIDDLDAETSAAIAELLLAEKRLEDRALSAFVRGDSFAISPSLEHDEILQSMAQQTMVESIFDQDEAAISSFQQLRASLDVETQLIYQRLQLLVSIEKSALDQVVQKREAIQQAEIELRAFEAGSEIFIDGLVFPVGDGVELPLIDSFGFARMTGTPDEHWHEGIDIFAPMNTPLLATERGVVTNIGSGRLGGNRFWLRGESGTDWYYAHLSSFADDLSEGQVVEAGDLLGYVGITGNAVGTPPHVHMQMHPDGGRPVNAYPLLATVYELDQEAALADQR